MMLYLHFRVSFQKQNDENPLSDYSLYWCKTGKHLV